MGRISLKLFHVFDFQRNVLASKKSFSTQDFVAFDRGGTLLHDFEIIPNKIFPVFFYSRSKSVLFDFFGKILPKTTKSIFRFGRIRVVAPLAKLYFNVVGMHP